MAGGLEVDVIQCNDCTKSQKRIYSSLCEAT